MCSSTAAPASDEPISADLLAKVESAMISASRGSWEIGTAAQAILEYHAQALTPFSSAHSMSPGPPPIAVPDYIRTSSAQIYDNRPSASTCLWGKGKVLWPEGAVGDLGSLVPILIVACHAEAHAGNRERAAQYADAAEKQVDYLLHDAPRAADGTMSHRAEQVQFWADFVYMTPPAVALWGLHQSSTDASRELLAWSYRQCGLQRQVFLDPATGLWKHILGGTEGRTDPGCWSTSNAWAAAGMLRVLVTIRRSPFAEEPAMQDHVADLLAWVTEIMSAVAARATNSGMVRNYVDQLTAFEESCGTALLAATGFRLAQLRLTEEYLPFAQKARKAIIGHIRESDGVLQAVSDIEDEHIDGGRSLSAEGQAFVLILEAAWRDWQEEHGRESE
jgi:rhamnogalacturonyl hydrolase YesR